MTDDFLQPCATCQAIHAHGHDYRWSWANGHSQTSIPVCPLHVCIFFLLWAFVPTTFARKNLYWLQKLGPARQLLADSDLFDAYADHDVMKVINGQGHYNDDTPL